MTKHNANGRVNKLVTLFAPDSYRDTPSLKTDLQWLKLRPHHRPQKSFVSHDLFPALDKPCTPDDALSGLSVRLAYCSIKFVPGLLRQGYGG